MDRRLGWAKSSKTDRGQLASFAGSAMLTPSQDILISENVLESRMATVSRGAPSAQVCSEFIDDVQRGAVP